MSERAPVRSDAATLQLFAAFVWLIDVVTAYAAGARWFTWHFVFPSLGLLLAAAWLALGVTWRAERRAQMAIALLAWCGAFSVWTFRLAAWPSNPGRWLLETIVIAAVPLVITFVSPRWMFVFSPLLIVGYQIAKSIDRQTFVPTLRRELPAIAIAAVASTAVWLYVRRPRAWSRRNAMIVAAAGGIVSFAGTVLLIAWSGRSFPIVATDGTPHGRARPAPNVVLIVIDTLRADRLGLYGYRTRPTSPFIDSLATRAAVYRNAYASSSWTVPSIATMFTGAQPEQHGVIVYGASLPPSRATLAERLRASGYATTAVVSNYLIDSEHGFARGFDRFALLARVNSQTGSPSPIWIDVLLAGHFWLPHVVTSGTPKPDARSVVDETLHAIDVAPRDRPLFVYMHLLDPHEPCDAPASAVTRTWRQSAADAEFDASWSVEYDGEVRYVDDELRRFCTTALPRLGTNTMFVLVADHGEQLGEHAKRGHGTNLDETLIRVPLIVMRPGAAAAGIDAPFSLTRLADLIVTSAATSDSEMRAHLVPPHSPDVTMTSVERERWKLVTIDSHAGRRELLFQLPDETRNELANAPQIADALRVVRDALPPTRAADIVDPEARAKMRALGYIH